MYISQKESLVSEEYRACATFAVSLTSLRLFYPKGSTVSPLSTLNSQAIGRGRAARTVAQERRQKRIEEQFRRASVWGQQVEGQGYTRANKRASKKRPPPKSSPQAPRPSSSLFSSGTGAAGRDATEASGGQKGRPEAATLIQAAFRGGKARWEADRLRDEFKARKIEADARAREKVQRKSRRVVRIRTVDFSNQSTSSLFAVQ